MRPPDVIAATSRKTMKTTTAIALLALYGGGSSAHAGPSTDDMSRCLVESTTKDDKAVLIRWIFVAVSQNAAASTLSTATAADIDKANAAVGALYTRLLTVDCAGKVKKAIKEEGETALDAAFKVLGGMANTELLADPKVSASLAGFGKYLDQKKFGALSDSAP
jgi:hypothetical protein